MTKVLIITNKRDITSDFIVRRLQEKGIPFYRLNTEELSKSCLISFDFGRNIFSLDDKILNQEIDLLDFTSVYYRRPELTNIDSLNLCDSEKNFINREFHYTLEGLYSIINDLYWISPVNAIRKAENKIYQLKIAKEIGFSIPDSIITNNFTHSYRFFNRNNQDCIVKPIKSGLIGNSSSLKIAFTNLLNEIPSKEQVEISPNFFQSHIKKQYDVRVTMVGEKAFATSIDSQKDIETQIDWRRGKSVPTHAKIDLPQRIIDQCILLLKTLDLRFGAIDFILDSDGNYIFLEINPNGQWGWIEKQTGYKISNEIVNLLENETF